MKYISTRIILVWFRLFSLVPWAISVWDPNKHIQLCSMRLLKQVWLWPYKSPSIVRSGSYDITIEFGSKDMSLEIYIQILLKNGNSEICGQNFRVFGKLLC